MHSQALQPAPQLVIFDCDGVLVDSERLSHLVLQQMLADLGLALTLEEAFGHFMGLSTETCRARIASLLGRPAPAGFMDDFQGRCFTAFAERLTPVPGVPELLHSLPVACCVASNGPHEKMRFTLGHTGLLPLLEGRLFSAQDVARPKPAPDLFLHAAATMGVAPARCVVVEDSATGVAAARAAGMTVLGHAAMGQADKLRAAGAHAVLHRMADVATWLR